jgi:hypothetical protein
VLFRAKQEIPAQFKSLARLQTFFPNRSCHRYSCRQMPHPLRLFAGSCSPRGVLNAPLSPPPPTLPASRPFRSTRCRRP